MSKTSTRKMENTIKMAAMSTTICTMMEEISQINKFHKSIKWKTIPHNLKHHKMNSIKLKKMRGNGKTLKKADFKESNKS